MLKSSSSTLRRRVEVQVQAQAQVEVQVDVQVDVQVKVQVRCWWLLFLSNASRKPLHLSGSSANSSCPTACCQLRDME